MRRREVLSLLTGAAIGSAFPEKAQQAAKIAHIAYLSVVAGRNPVDETFEAALQQLGWTINRNITIEYRYAGGVRIGLRPLLKRPSAHAQMHSLSGDHHWRSPPSE
jgi:hypothetical protein